MEIKFEASKPDRGSFTKFDSERQAEVRMIVDATQYLEVMKLNALAYGETFKVQIIGKIGG